MADRTRYIERVRKGIEVYEAMAALEDGEKMVISFGNRGEFQIRCHQYKNVDREKSYSISDGRLFGRSMNIDSEKSGKSYLYCYTFDLFSNKTVAKLYFEHITIVNPNFKEEETK